jgi:hypothetical protein
MKRITYKTILVVLFAALCITGGACGIFWYQHRDVIEYTQNHEELLSASFRASTAGQQTIALMKKAQAQPKRYQALVANDAHLQFAANAGELARRAIGHFEQETHLYDRCNGDYPDCAVYRAYVDFAQTTPQAFTTFVLSDFTNVKQGTSMAITAVDSLYELCNNEADPYAECMRLIQLLLVQKATTEPSPDPAQSASLLIYYAYMYSMGNGYYTRADFTRHVTALSADNEIHSLLKNDENTLFAYLQIPYAYRHYITEDVAQYEAALRFADTYPQIAALIARFSPLPFAQ